MPVTLRPIPMSKENMSRLEEKGLIHRIAPGKDIAGPVDGCNLGRSLYESDIRFGGHKCIVATVGATTLKHFGCHDDREDVWLLGLDTWKPLYFVFATCLEKEFTEKVIAGTLTDDDFVCLRVHYNDPEASFFTVHKYVPHGEFIVPREGDFPSFYVTEPTDLQVKPLAFGRTAIHFQDSDACIDVTPPL